MSEEPSVTVNDLTEQERQRCEIWTRVMGYHRPVSSFNIGKKGEFAERRCFIEIKGTDIGEAPEFGNTAVSAGVSELCANQ